MSEAGLSRFSSGIRGLDEVLGGGFFRGGLYLIQGTPGTGKTTFANQLCFHRIAAGERAVYFTLLAEYHVRMMQYIGRMSFFDEAKLPDQLSYISGFSVMRDEGLKALLTLMRREILLKKVSLLIVDGLIAAQRLVNDDQKFNEFIHELQGIAIATGCTVFLVTSSDRGARSTPEHTMVDGIIEMSDQTAGWAVQRALQVSKIRGSAYLRGKHVYKITDDGIVIFPRLESLMVNDATLNPEVTERVSSGNATLDAMLCGGFPGGSPTLLLGPSGIGKTTFGLQFLSQSTPAVPGLMMGFYEPPSRLLAKARSVCRPLVDLVSDGTVEVLWQPPSIDSLDAYADRLLSELRRRRVKRLFLDGLGAFRNAPATLDRLRLFLPTLTNELRALGVTTIYSLEVVNITGPDASTNFGDLSVLAENLLLLRYVEYQSQLKRLISVLKVRDSDFDPALHEFAITAGGPTIDPSPDSAATIMNSVSPWERGVAANTRQTPSTD
jgi:circadian clock protein KaiC